MILILIATVSAASSLATGIVLNQFAERKEMRRKIQAKETNWIDVGGELFDNNLHLIVSAIRGAGSKAKKRNMMMRILSAIESCEAENKIETNRLERDQ